MAQPFSLALGSSCFATRSAVSLTAIVLVASNSACLADESLRVRLEEMAAGFASKTPEAMRSAFAEGIDEVRRSGLVQTAKNLGDDAPDRDLVGLGGERVSLSAAWADGPAVVTFYRGGWCPYCNLTLKALQESLAEIEGAGATLVAITPEIDSKAAETAEKNGLGFTVLTDPGNAVAREFGIVFPLAEAILPIYRDRLKLSRYNGNEDYELPLAATYVIDSSGVIRWAFLDADYKKRAEPADIVAAVRSLQEP